MSASRVPKSKGINPKLDQLIRKKKTPDVQWLKAGLLEGKISVLSEAITLLERDDPSWVEEKQALIRSVYQSNPQSWRITITGAPGVGKSSFIEQLGKEALEDQKQLAVLAIDPTSPNTQGSILGDKTRMPFLAQHPQAFVRPSPSALHLGGVTAYTQETIWLCEAAGYNTVLLETVGVGQSESEAKQLTDLFILLIQPGAGDTVQGIKRGIVELADLIVIHKADGEMLPLAEQSYIWYQQALQLIGGKTKLPNPLMMASSLTKRGISDIYNVLKSYFYSNAQKIEQDRINQNAYWLRAYQYRWAKQFIDRQLEKEELQQILKKVKDYELPPREGAHRLIKDIFVKTT